MFWKGFRGKYNNKNMKSRKRGFGDWASCSLNTRECACKNQIWIQNIYSSSRIKTVNKGMKGMKYAVETNMHNAGLSLNSKTMA